MSPELKAHYASSAQTVATFWKITRTDAKQFGYTNLDRDVPIQGRNYSAVVGAAATAIASSNDLSVQNVEITGLLQQGLVSIGAITEDDILRGVWDGARVTIFEANYEDPTMGIVTLQTGYLGQLATGQLTYTAEVRGLMQTLSQNIGHQVQPGCWKDLGDVNCQIDLSLYTFSGAVESVTNQAHWFDSSLAKADHYFRYGKVNWLTGPNAPRSMEIKDYLNAGDILLQSQMFDPIAVGDTYTISAGCDKLLKRADQVYAAAISGSITSIAGSSFVDTGLVNDDHFFDGGLFSWTSGPNVGAINEVMTYINQTITLVGGYLFPLTNGDAFTIEPQINTGAEVYTGECATKFDNAVNHGGFCECPGNDKVLGAGNNGNGQ